MPLTQQDRDRIEDTQLDPSGDHTEVLHPINANGPGSVAADSRTNVRNPNR